MGERCPELGDTEEFIRNKDKMGKGRRGKGIGKRTQPTNHEECKENAKDRQIKNG